MSYLLVSLSKAQKGFVQSIFFEFNSFLSYILVNLGIKLSSNRIRSQSLMFNFLLIKKIKKSQQNMKFSSRSDKESEVKASLTSTQQIQKRASNYHHNIQMLNLCKYYKLRCQFAYIMLNHIIEYNPVTWVGDKIFARSKLLTNLAAYFSNLFINSASPRAQKFLFAIGLASITYKLSLSLYNKYQFWKFLPGFLHNQSHYKPQKLKEKYGECYVLITGAADGIGYAYSREFAKLGFNLIMADIQAEKLEFRKNEILNTFKNIQIESFVVDMSDNSKTREFVGKIKDFDIGIIVNNVGLTGGGNYVEIDPKVIMKTLIVNYWPMYEINKILLPKLRQRNKRSAIINMSSATGYYFSQSVGAYSSIKFAMDIYTRTLAAENRDKVDILSVRPFGVSTGMLKMRKAERIITPKHCAVSVLTQLGTADAIFPSLPHKLMASYFESLPEEERLVVYQAAWQKNRQAKN